MEVFHGLTDGTGAMQFLKELVRNYLMFTYPKESFPEFEMARRLLTATMKRTVSLSIIRGRKAGTADQGKLISLRGNVWNRAEMEISEICLSASAVHRKARDYGVSVTTYLAAAFLYAIYEEVPKSRLKRPVSLMIPVNLRNFFPSGSMINFWSWIETAYDFGEDTKLEDVN